MNRTTLLQNIIDKGKFKSYLEIGTHKGMSLFPLKCKYKIAVDPSFKIKSSNKLNWLLKNPCNFRNIYFELTSDQFFNEQEKFLMKIGKLDVVFIDGLHTFEASLKDALNSLKYLNKSGVIVMHDCLPPHKVAAMPLNSFEEGKKKSIEGWDGQWCGDVWKTIVYLKENHNENIDVYVLDTDFGLGIIKFKKEAILELNINLESFKEIDKLEYEYLISNPEKIINLKDKTYANKIFSNKALS